jgi:predicted nucleotidyltransferase
MSMTEIERCEDNLLETIVERMVNVHGCHTILLYGSRAGSRFERTSDYDVCGFRDAEEAICDCEEIDGLVLDAWIYPTAMAETPDVSMLRLKDSRILVDRDGLGKRCIENVRRLYELGPSPLPDWEKQKRIVWLRKTLARTKKGDLEGRYRTLWLLHLALEYYFELRGEWYRGSKESLSWLEKNDPRFLAKFQTALKDPFDNEALTAAIHAVIPNDSR